MTGAQVGMRGRERTIAEAPSAGRLRESPSRRDAKPAAPRRDRGVAGSSDTEHPPVLHLDRDTAVRLAKRALPEDRVRDLRSLDRCAVRPYGIVRAPMAWRGAQLLLA